MNEDDNVTRIAKLIATMHGSQMTHSSPSGEMETVASRHGFGHWGHSPEKYAERYWQQYVNAARAVTDTIDYKRLLKKYIERVEWLEGVTFLSGECPDGFSPEEWDELKKLDVT